MANEVAVIRDYDIRDKKLVDATAQSTINSTDAIEMKTTDGSQVFIDKASFIKAVGQAFTASDPKTFTKLLGMNGDGPMGIGASDIASVLGVVNGLLPYKKEWGPLNDVVDTGIYIAYSNNGAPEVSGGYLLVISYGSSDTLTRVFQLWCRDGHSDCIYFRNKRANTWSNWYKLTGTAV